MRNSPTFVGRSRLRSAKAEALPPSLPTPPKQSLRLRRPGAKATEGSPHLHPRSKLRGIRRRRIKRIFCRNKRRSEFFQGVAKIEMTETIEAALRPIRNSLQADGFDLKVEVVEDGVVSLVVLAGPEACPRVLDPRRTL